MYDTGQQFFYFDIETIPTQDGAVKARLAEGISAPANYTDPAKIETYIASKAADAVAKTSFDGFLGHVCAVSYSAEGREPNVFSAHSIDEEPSMIRALFDAMDRTGKNTLVGHNIIGFDIPFITRRALCLGIELPQSNVWPCRNLKPWGDKVNDTMIMAAVGTRDFISLDSLCRAFGIPGKDGFDGSQVAQAWADGEHAKIAEYCAADVIRTRAVHERFLKAGW